jgi:hypothetical protein
VHSIPELTARARALQKRLDDARRGRDRRSDKVPRAVLQAGSDMMAAIGRANAAILPHPDRRDLAHLGSRLAHLGRRLHLAESLSMPTEELVAFAKEIQQLAEQVREVAGAADAEAGEMKLE